MFLWNSEWLILVVTVGQSDDTPMDDDIEESGMSSGEPGKQRQEPLGGVNGNPETDDKENNNGLSTDETQAVRYGFERDEEA